MSYVSDIGCSGYSDSAARKSPRINPLNIVRKFPDRAEVQSFRRVFCEVWQEFIHAEFESHVEVALYFKVDPTTAEKWWAGSHAPQGWVIGRALMDDSLQESLISKVSGE